MLSRRADGSVLVQVPDPAQDRPSWKTVATIAAVGFVIGIVWPHFAGVRLGPSLPEASPLSAAASSSVTPQTPSATPLVAAPPAPASSGTTNGRASSPGGSASTRSGGDAADGTGLVVWEVAIVRDAPKTGKIVARLPRGSPLRIGPVRDGWYPVRYGDGFAGDGWVYRGAIGR